MEKSWLDGNAIGLKNCDMEKQMIGRTDESIGTERGL